MELLKIFGDVILCLSIIAGGITFVIVNVNYKQDDKDEG